MERTSVLSEDGNSQGVDYGAFSIGNSTWSMPLVSRSGCQEGTRILTEDTADIIVALKRSGETDMSEAEVLSRLGYGLADNL